MRWLLLVLTALALAGCSGSADSGRKIILISGILTENSRAEPMAVSGWADLRQFLAGNTRVQDELNLQDDDFLYFSYSGKYGGPQDNPYKLPIYDRSDTLLHSVPVLAARLDDLVRRFPDASFDIVGHSLGGVIAAYWAAAVADDKLLSRVHTIITIDSPLRGADSPCLIAVAGATRMLDLEPHSPVISALAKAPAKVQMLTIRNSGDEIVTADSATLDGVWRDYLDQLGRPSYPCDLSPHTQVRTEPTLHRAVVDALLAGNDGWIRR